MMQKPQKNQTITFSDLIALRLVDSPAKKAKHKVTITGNCYYIHSLTAVIMRL